MKRSGLGRSVVHMVGSAMGVRVSSIVLGIVIRRILGPRLVGIWNMLEIVSSYLAAITVGLPYSTERLLPLYRRRGEEAEERRMLALLFGWNLAELLVVCAGVCVFLVLFADTYEETTRRALYFLPLVFAAQKLLSLYPVLLRGAKHFGVYAGTSLVIAQIDWLLIVWAWFGGLLGMVLGFVLNAAIKVAYYQRIGRRLRLFSSGFRIDFAALRPHFPYAPRYALFKALFTVVERIDALFVASVLGPTALGYYYLGYRLASAALEVPNALVYVAYPHLVESLAAGAAAARALAKEFDRFIRVTLFLLLPCVIPLGYFGSEIVIRHLLPAFAPGIWPVKIVMLAVGLQALRQLYYRAFMVHEQVGRLALVTLPYFPVFFGSYFIIAGVGVDALIAAAVANLIGNVVNVAGLYGASWQLIHGGEATGRGYRALELLSHLALLGLVVAVDVVSPLRMGGSFFADAAGFALRLVTFAVLAFPFVYVGLGRERKAVALSVLRAFK